MTWSDSLFYLAFIGQIYFISHYFPRIVAKRVEFVMQTYPPEKFPKLYPQSVEYYRIGLSAYRMLNRAIVLLGIGILVAIVFWVDHATFADDGFISEFWPATYGFIQFVPLMILEFSAFRQFRLMREANLDNTVRKADLRPRRLRDFVSPLVLGLACTAFVAAILFDVYVHQFDVRWEHGTIQRTITLTATNLFMGAIGAWLLRGKKLDPHQSPADRTRHIRASLSSFLYVSITVSLFFMVTAADDVYDIDFLDAPLMSIYFQVIVFLSVGHLLRSLPLDSLNFDVYKNS